MAKNDDLQFEHLRRITGTPSPTSEERQAALARLQHAIQAETAPSRQRFGLVRPIPVMALVVLVAVIALISLRTPSATASLLELAHAAERVDPITLDPGQTIYTKAAVTRLNIISGEEIGVDIEAVAYLLPLVEETWDKGDSSIVVSSTVGAPTFFDPSVELAYYQAGHDKTDRVGESFEEAFTGVTDQIAEQEWPNDPDTLLETMTDWVNQDVSPLPDDVELFQLAGHILRTHSTQPALRAAILEVLATLNLTVTRDPDVQTLTATITYERLDATLAEHLTFNPAGYLIADGTTTDTAIPELGIPAHSAIARGLYTIPIQTTWDDNRP